MVHSELNRRRTPIAIVHLCRGPIRVVHSRPHIFAAASALAVWIGPTHHKTSPFKARNRRLILVTTLVGVHAELIPHYISIHIVTLPTNIATTATRMTAVITPCHHKASILGPRHCWLVLVTRSMGVHAKLFAHFITKPIVALCPDIVSRTPAVTTVITPRHHKASILQRSHRWIILIVLPVCVNNELSPQRKTRRTINTGIDAPVPATPKLYRLLVLRLPCHDITTPSQTDRRYFGLTIICKLVQPELLRWNRCHARPRRLF